MFEESLIESTRASRKSGRGIFLPLSIALHILVLAAAIGASFVSVEEDPDPPIPVIFHAPGSLPSPSGASSRTNSLPPRTARRAPPTTQSVAIFKTAPSTVASPDVQTGRDSDSLFPYGDQKEIPGSIDDGDGDNGQIGLGRGAQTTLRPGGDVRPPLLIERVEPAYPEIERKLRKEGIVILEAIITSAGTVDEVRVLKSADAILDEAAKQAVMQWRYRPATLNGRAVRVYLTVTVFFRLHWS